MPVVDASLVIDWIVAGTDPTLPTMIVRDRLAGEGTDLLAPRPLLLEVASGLLRGVRRRLWTGAEADEGLGVLQKLPVRLVDDFRYLDRAWELARRYDNHPIYDMIYVAVAERAATQLITADQVLSQRLAHLGWVIAANAVH